MAKNSTYYEKLEELVRLARVIFDHVESYFDTISLEALDNAVFQVSEYHREALNLIGDNIDPDSRRALSTLESYFEELEGMFHQKETDL
jgi:hypothetical protein